MPRFEVEWFADQMEKELRRNDHKGGWDYCEASWLLKRLRQEVGELERALKAEVRPKRIISEAADVANFAMMIADNVRQ